MFYYLVYLAIVVATVFVGLPSVSYAGQRFKGKFMPTPATAFSVCLHWDALILSHNLLSWPPTCSLHKRLASNITWPSTKYKVMCGKLISQCRACLMAPRAWKMWQPCDNVMTSSHMTTAPMTVCQNVSVSWHLYAWSCHQMSVYWLCFTLYTTQGTE